MSNTANVGTPKCVGEIITQGKTQCKNYNLYKIYFQKCNYRTIYPLYLGQYM